MDIELEILLIKKELLHLKYGTNGLQEKYNGVIMNMRENPYHDPENGRFTSGHGGSSGSSSEISTGNSGNINDSSTKSDSSSGNASNTEADADSGETADSITASIGHLIGNEYAVAFVDLYVKDPLSLGATTPQQKYDELIKHGVDVVPLGDGDLDGRPFTEGGGFRVTNLPDGRLFMYHPKKSSHHETAYYKLSSGQSGKRRYDMDGHPIND